jgi:hypothetical protein
MTSSLAGTHIRTEIAARKILGTNPLQARRLKAVSVLEFPQLLRRRLGSQKLRDALIFGCEGSFGRVDCEWGILLANAFRTRRARF